MPIAIFRSPIRTPALSLLACTVLAALQTGAAERIERGNVVLDDVPAAPAALMTQLAPYLEVRRTLFLDWTPDGAMLVATRAGNVEQVHRIDEPLGAFQQLTSADEPVTRAKYSPGGAYPGFLFSKDMGGNENTQIYFQSLEGGDARLLTDGRSVNGAALWSNNGRQIAFFSNARAAASYDIYLMEPDSAGPPRLALALEGGAWCPLDFSPDDTRLLLKNEISSVESYLYVADLSTGKKERIAPAADRERIAIGDARFARNGQGVYYVSDQGSEFKQLRYLEFGVEPDKKPTETRLSAPVPWDVEAFDLSDDGRYLVYATNEGGTSRLRLRDVRNGLDLPSPVVPSGRIANLGFDPSGTRIAITLETARTPSEVCVYQIGSGALTQWTQGDAGSLETADFVDAQLIYYPTFDNTSRGAREIPAFVFKPQSSEPSPVVIDLRGGPEMEYRPGFEAFTQFLVKELGITVIAPNVRGSNGYGRSYLQLDDQFKREDAVKDVGALLAWIAQQPNLDRRRVIVMGYSYGGYLTLASLMHFGDRLLGGIDVSGINNFVSFLQNATDYGPFQGRDARRAEYGDERDIGTESFLRRLSPLHNSQRIGQPLLIVQGQNDPQVSAAESERMAATIRGRGGEVWYLLAQDEGHAWRKKQNRDLYLQTAATFINGLLRPSSGP